MTNTCVEFSVPEWSALFIGHFDEAPVLSGVSQLFLLQGLLERFLPGKTVTGFERLRFKATSGPRDQLRAEFSLPNDRGQLRVKLSRQADTVLEGVLNVR
jgi:3-hydroxymyristoyl/3-hydroxydecanoyl-(acyl carrier protein) dehydratase